MKTALFNGFKGFGKVICTKFRQMKPEIALGIGIVGMAAGTIYACTKTKQAEDAIYDMNYKLENEKMAYEDDKNDAGGDERALKDAQSDHIREVCGIYIHTAYEFLKIYWAPAVLWGAGLGSIIYSHTDLRKENGKLLLNSMAAKKVFDAYRAKVKEKLGEEEERDLYFGAEEREIELSEYGPDGKESKTVKKKGKLLKENGGSMFARNFSSRTSYEFDVRSYADYFLELKIKELNKKLKCVPFITMNEVYDELGMKTEYGRCAEGLDWGWVWNPMNPDGPNEIVVEELEGWEEHLDEYTGKKEYYPCLRIDFNPQYLRGLI